MKIFTKWCSLNLIDNFCYFIMINNKNNLCFRSVSNKLLLCFLWRVYLSIKYAFFSQEILVPCYSSNYCSTQFAAQSHFVNCNSRLKHRSTKWVIIACLNVCQSIHSCVNADRVRNVIHTSLVSQYIWPKTFKQVHMINALW